MFWYNQGMDANVLRSWLGSMLARPVEENTLVVDAALMASLKKIAQQENRPLRAVAGDLLASAILQRQYAESNLCKWRALTLREQEVAALVCQNKTNRQIAALLRISPETVKSHVRSILAKFNRGSKAELRRDLEEWDFSAWKSPSA